MGKLVRCYKIPVGYFEGRTSLFVSIKGHYHYLLDYILLPMNFSNIVIRGTQSWIFISNNHRFYCYWITRYHKVQQFLSLAPLYFISLYCFYIKNSYHFSCNRRLCSRLLFSSNPSYEYYIFSESVFLCKREYNTYIYKTCWFFAG